MGVAVILGNSIKYKNEIKNDFNFKFNWDHKVWFKECVSEETFPMLETIIEAKFKGCRIYWMATLDLINVAKEVQREEFTPKAEAVESEYTNKILEVSKWYAGVFKENNKTEYAFRNLKISNVYRETEKALQVDATFYGGIACRCGVCGRELNNDISRATGIGPVCATKIGLPRPTMDSAKEIVKRLEEMSGAQGEFKKVWIPKSQIKEILEV
jgi:hypothetical protein